MNQLPFASRYDAIVIGARCAGAATAMLLARSGLRVLVADRSEYGADTLSTHALMRGAVLQLRRWGVLPHIVMAGTPPVTSTTFHYGDEVLAVPIKPKHGVDALYAPRRTLLDRALIDAAIASGVDVRYGLRLVDVVRDASGKVSGVVLVDRSGAAGEVAGDLVIGADGMRSSVAELVGAPIYRAGQHASAVVYGYWPGIPVDGYQWYYQTGTGAGAIPTNDGEALIFASVSSPRWESVFGRDAAAGYRQVLRDTAPELADRCAASTAPGRLTGFSGQLGYYRQSYGDGWALVGDAGYFKDPLTAHGITDALRDAELLAAAVLDSAPGALARYQEARDALTEGLFTVTDRIASFEWTTDTVGALLETLAREMSDEVKAMVATSAMTARV